MADELLIGVDIGTQGTKAALFNKAGRCLAESFVSSNLIRLEPGAVEEDPAEQVAAVCGAVKECVEKTGVDPADIAGIAIDGQMAGIIGIGEDGTHLTPYDSWLDTRCAPYIKKMNEAAPEEIIAKTGGPASFNHGPKILWWKHEHPDLYNKIRAFVTPGGYAAMKLCGLGASQAFIDTSYLHFSGYADNLNKRWDKDLCREFDIDMQKLPRIVSPNAIVGSVIPSMAAACGLRTGTRVVAGCGDTAASFLSCGATKEGICVDVAGTASVFATTTSRFITDKSGVLGSGQSTVPGFWHPYAYINGGGMNLEWFRGQITGAKELDFDELNLLAEKIESSPANPLFIPHFGGRVCPSQPDMRGAWIGLDWDCGIPALYRSMLEGVALEYGIYLDTLKSIDSEFSPLEFRITGGGEKSEVWNRIKADALQVPVLKLERSEGAPLGCALLAGNGVGLFENLDQAADGWVNTSDRILPDPGKAEHYRKRIKRYTYLLDAVDRSARL
jgi:xylulokinase